LGLITLLEIIMKAKYRIPWLAILLIVLASFRFDKYTETLSLTYDGPAVGLFVVVIIGIFLLFKLTSLWADYLVYTGKIVERSRFRFDVLIAVGIIAPMIGYTARGTSITGPEGTSVPSWLFQWGQSEAKFAFILGIIALVLVIRVYTIVTSLVSRTSVSNRVGGRIDLPPPTPPDMRVRVRRFLAVPKD